MRPGLDSIHVVLIGSGSGKTTFVRRLRLANPDFATFQMDVVLNALDEARLPLAGRAYRRHGDRVTAMAALGPALCRRARVRREDHSRRGWVEPHAWSMLAQGRRAVAVDFGFPSATPEEVRDRLAETGHWLSTADDRPIVEAQIAHSHRLQTRSPTWRTPSS